MNIKHIAAQIAFQFQSGAIKSVRAVNKFRHLLLFQFQSGAIIPIKKFLACVLRQQDLEFLNRDNSNLVRLKVLKRVNEDIGKGRFNSNLVRLKAAISLENQIGRAHV